MVEIAVLIKQVPDTSAKIEVSGGKVDLSSVKWITSPYDEFAIEAALQHKESAGGTVTAITLGPESCDKALKDAKAIGVDNLVRIWNDGWDYMDSHAIQSALSQVVSNMGATAVYCGKSAADTGAGSTGPGVAQRLGWPSLSNIVGIKFTGDSLEVTQPGPNGQSIIGVNLPALISCDKGMNEPRRANVRGIMMAKKATIEVIGDIGTNSNVSMVGHSSPPEKPPGKTFEGAENIPHVVKLLRDEANII
tara:strand:+ start:678 stop:1424 length:747 start_codon:yes stop_codon:yes gene_type:complete